MRQAQKHETFTPFLYVEVWTSWLIEPSFIARVSVSIMTI